MGFFYRKFIILLVLLIEVLTIFSFIEFNSVFAQSGCDCTAYCEDPKNVSEPPGCICFCPSEKIESPEVVIERIINWIMGAAIVIAPIMFSIAAFHFMSAAGSQEKIKKARQIFFYALIGLFLTLLAKGLVFMLKQILGVS